MKWKSTYKKLNVIGDVLIKGLQDTLRVQKHNATHKLSNSFRKDRKQKSLTLNVITNRKYWKIVNNGKAAFKPNLNEIEKWVVAKRIKGSGSSGNPSAMQQRGIALRIAKNIERKGIPSKPYVVWTEGNNLKRTNFAGVTKEKKEKEVTKQLTGGVVADVVSMIRSEIKRNTTIKK
mgnify:FL=1|tara:strand:- start:2832 stop:3359 length:528 start_codon:yes stop_codon:yes gene_type:complete